MKHTESAHTPDPATARRRRYVETLAELVDGDETEYVNELIAIAEEMEETIDSDTAKSMLTAAAKLVKQ